jgi:Xaa-Pro aminopeptidase
MDIDSFIVVPAGDCHASEYISDCDARRMFISGFSGTAGDAVINHDKAALHTDGRYYNQASQQLDDSWTLLKQGLPGVPSWQEWAAEQAQGGKTVAVDPELVTRDDANELQALIEEEGGKLVPLDSNLIDEVWGNEQPARPREPVFTQPIKYSGKSVDDKLTWLRGVLAKKRAAGIVITMLDEIAWLFNVRGQDLPSNPVFFSYAVVTQDKATIWVDKSRMDEETVANLTASSVELKPYDEFFPDVKQLRPSSNGGRKFLISGTASWRVYLALDNGKLAKVEDSPVAEAKTVKTPEELEGLRRCHIRDGAAIIDYLSWLEDQIVGQKKSVTEFEGVEKLRECREKQERYVGISFATISCSGPK